MRYILLYSNLNIPQHWGIRYSVSYGHLCDGLVEDLILIAASAIANFTDTEDGEQKPNIKHLQSVDRPRRRRWQCGNFERRREKEGLHFASQSLQCLCTWFSSQERLGCVLFRAVAARKTRNLARPWLENPVQGYSYDQRLEYVDIDFNVPHTPIVGLWQ